MKKITLLFLLLPFLGLSQVQIGQDIDGVNELSTAGYAVALNFDGSILALGVPNESVIGNSFGAVRVYENQNNTWVQIGEDIDGVSSSDFFGLALSINNQGTKIVIGSYSNDNGINSGQTKVFENQSDSWVQIGQDINGVTTNDYSGSSVSINAEGDVIAIGAPLNDGIANNTGHVRVYEYQVNSWVQIGEDIEGEAFNDRLGSSVSLNDEGNILAIGAPLYDANSVDSGYVKIYGNQSGFWVQIGQNINGADQGDILGERSGSAISLNANGNIVAIGAPRGDDIETNSGNVRVYENVSGIWTQIGLDIIGNGEGSNDNSGYSISLNDMGNILIIGAPAIDNANKTGYARIFKYQLDSWVQVGVDINGDINQDQFGFSVTINTEGSIVAVGAPYHDATANTEDFGHTRVFSIVPELAILEVVEDILGNTNGINVTADQLNSITGVSGAIEGINYTTAIANGTFVDENNPTVAEIQAIINQVNNALSLNENDVFNFKLYPNPTKNQFIIQLDPLVQLQKVAIYNTLGQVVLTSEEKNINTSTLSSGSYIVEIITNNGKSSKKLIIE
ncbi:T9SS type A sorting domain-containing protein [Psychroserpens burtonensis]|uniref:T9SS type A sorting domain-containing protein n=1 Tax=Psychroserpens burtonensis TaxID=49278 RepID=A0A5C7BHK2_9FLAO|nr:T9SS type A sorting domain-containing protein [Psychroserpens burtonensis]TXE19133.1 T9SS type A sorting domain-containing protein [Psychroserpens burtonensis]